MIRVAHRSIREEMSRFPFVKDVDNRNPFVRNKAILFRYALYYGKRN
jgi:hypothetical protein